MPRSRATSTSRNEGEDSLVGANDFRLGTSAADAFADGAIAIELFLGEQPDEDAAAKKTTAARRRNWRAVGCGTRFNSAAPLKQGRRNLQRRLWLKRLKQHRQAWMVGFVFL